MATNPSAGPSSAEGKTGVDAAVSRGKWAKPGSVMSTQPPGQSKLFFLFDKDQICGVDYETWNNEAWYSIVEELVSKTKAQRPIRCKNLVHCVPAAICQDHASASFGTDWANHLIDVTSFPEKGFMQKKIALQEYGEYAAQADYPTPGDGYGILL